MWPRHSLTACATAALALCASASLAQTSNPPAPTDTTIAQQRVTIEGHYDNSVGTQRRRLARHDPRRAAQEPAAATAGRGAGVRARRHRHAALGRRQGQPVFPARLQPRPRHRLRHRRRRHAGEHAHARPRPGLHRPELPDSRAGAAHRVPQGAVLRARRRLRRRRLGRDRVPHAVRRAVRPADAGRERLSAAACSAARSTLANQTTLLGVFEAMRNDGPWTLDENLQAPQRRAHATAAARRRRAGASPAWATTPTGAPPTRSRSG